MRLALERRAALTGVPSGAERMRKRRIGGSAGKNGTDANGDDDDDDDDEGEMGGADPVATWRAASAEAERVAAEFLGAQGGQALLRGDQGWSLEGGGEVRGAAAGTAGRRPPDARASPAVLTAGADGVIEVGRRRRRRRGRALASAEDWLPGVLGRWWRQRRRRRPSGEAGYNPAAAASLQSAAANASSAAAATVYIGYLQSYRAMGRARLSCASGCACAPVVVDAFTPAGSSASAASAAAAAAGGGGVGRSSQTVLARLRGVLPANVSPGYTAEGRWVGGGGGSGSRGSRGRALGKAAATAGAEAAAPPMCVVRVEVLPAAAAPSPGGTKFKVSAVMVSREVHYGAYGDHGDLTMPLALEHAAQQQQAGGGGG